MGICCSTGNDVKPRHPSTQQSSNVSNSNNNSTLFQDNSTPITIPAGNVSDDIPECLSISINNFANLPTGSQSFRSTRTTGTFVGSLNENYKTPTQHKFDELLNSPSGMIFRGMYQIAMFILNTGHFDDKTDAKQQVSAMVSAMANNIPRDEHNTAHPQPTLLYNAAYTAINQMHRLALRNLRSAPEDEGSETHKLRYNLVANAILAFNNTPPTSQVVG